MSKKEGCVDEFNMSLSEINKADEVLQSSDSDFFLKSQTEGLSTRYMIRKNVGGFEFDIFWFQSSSTFAFENLENLILEKDSTIVFTEAPECAQEGAVIFIEDATRFPAVEPGSRISLLRAQK